MSAFHSLQTTLRAAPKTWLVTGVAGFIGSNLLEALLKLDQIVVGLDNFSTGRLENLHEVKTLVTSEQWNRFRFIEGDIADLGTCQEACAKADFVLHQAALGSVPRSLADPLGSHRSNVTGFLNMLIAARAAHIQRFVFASSSAVYGDHPGLPKVEERTGQPLSPYAATKAINEMYAAVLARAGGFSWVALRYFNVFGPRQDPDGPYAAVIPKWVSALLNREPVTIYGDGETSRDFSFVANVVQANLLAATTDRPEALNQAYNVGVGERTNLNDLFTLLQSALRSRDPSLPEQKPVYKDFRPGDVQHSLASIDKAKRLLGYEPTHRIAEGIELALDWYCNAPAVVHANSGALHQPAMVSPV
jgi:UDP-N-acetylglucosamine 4-epimerase